MLRVVALLFFILRLSAQTLGTDTPFRFALAGDSIIDRRISVYNEPGYIEIFNRIRSADAAFTNFEMLIHNFEFPGAPVSGGTYMGACRHTSSTNSSGPGLSSLARRIITPSTSEPRAC